MRHVRISITGGTHITQAYTKMNDTYFDTAQYNTTAWRNLVMCQEIAHAFGLDHQDEDFNNANLGMCMDYTKVPSTNQHRNRHDYDQLVTIYSHTSTHSPRLVSRCPPPARPRSATAPRRGPLGCRLGQPGLRRLRPRLRARQHVHHARLLGAAVALAVTR
jgi:hypothetical protein